MNETEDCDLSLGGNVWNVAQTDERRTVINGETPYSARNYGG